MALEIDQIIINRRSLVVHTKNCESVKQMKESNKDLIPAKTVEDLKKGALCGHCIKKRDMEYLYKAELNRRVGLVEKRRKRDHQRVDDKYDAKIKELEKHYHEQLEELEV